MGYKFRLSTFDILCLIFGTDTTLAMMKFAIVMISFVILSTIWINVVEMRAVENTDANSLQDRIADTPLLNDRCISAGACTSNSQCCPGYYCSSSTGNCAGINIP